MRKIKVILIGAGDRGTGYTRQALLMPENYEIVAVAEPIKARRDLIASLAGLPADCCFESWEPLLTRKKFADACLICTMDREHFAPTMAAIGRGYDIMLEKPIAPTPEECVAITRAAEEKGVQVLICHVLRFTPFYGRLKQLILSGVLGDVQAITQRENVGLIHQSHSFVRGNWGNESRSSPMLLQKSCHDIDIIQWLMDKKIKAVQSFGSLEYFTAAHAPAGAPERCLSGCPVADSCPFNAKTLYFDHKNDLWFRRACTKGIAHNAENPSDEDVLQALRTTNYGRCVFRCDNDVVDRQVVNLEFDDNAVCSFTMTAFTGGRGGREIRIHGTKGSLSASMSDTEIAFTDFATDETTMIPVSGGTGDNTIVGGHGGGDQGIMHTFCRLVDRTCNDVSVAPIRVSCENHMAVFAAEESRKTNRVVDVREYAARYGL